MNRFFLLVATVLVAVALVSCGPEKIENVDVEWHDFSEVSKWFPMSAKPIFLYVKENACPYCDHMDSAVFARPEVADYLNRHFLPVKVDIIEDMPITVRDSVMGEDEFRKLLSIQGIPALFFFETDGRVVGALDRSLDLLNFKRMMVYVRNGHFGKMRWEQWLQTDEADLDTVRGLF